MSSWGAARGWREGPGWLEARGTLWGWGWGVSALSGLWQRCIIMKISVSIRAANLVWPVTLDCGFHPPPPTPLQTEAPLYPVASLFMCACTDAHKNRGPTCTQQSRAFIGHFNGGAQTVASLLCSPSSAVHSSSSSSSSASLFTKQHWTAHSRPEEKEQNLQGAVGGLEVMIGAVVRC